MTSLIDEFIAEQRNLTAVERFARSHDSDAASGAAARTSLHRSLIPLSKPSPGEQYAFEVDLDRCSGCKSCVTACHALNGLDEDETWRSVGVLHSQSDHSFLQAVTTACHHCADPACLSGCPVLAYDKDPVTGIVRHLDDQCIGCQYCVMMCPYEVPRYSAKRGIVRKCDMCQQRLGHSEAPACVQACPTEAIRITLVRNAETSGFGLPGAPDPGITRPTTRYLTQKSSLEKLQPADVHEVRPQPGHMPLVWMLVLTQLGVGGFVLLPLLADGERAVASIIALAGTFLGLGISVLHLGRPSKAWRAFLGLRQSWLSREIIAFGAFASLAATQALAHIGAPVLTSAAGLAGVLSSGMTYHVTRREVWRGEFSVGRFFATTLVLGLAVAWCAACVSNAPHVALGAALSCSMALKLARELAQLRACSSDAEYFDEIPAGMLGRCAYLLQFRYGAWMRARLACALAGGIALPLVSLAPGSLAGRVGACGLALCLTGELLERSLFFKTGVAPKMPGDV